MVYDDSSQIILLNFPNFPNFNKGSDNLRKKLSLVVMMFGILP